MQQTHLRPQPPAPPSPRRRQGLSLRAQSTGPDIQVRLGDVEESVGDPRPLDSDPLSAAEVFREAVDVLVEEVDLAECREDLSTSPVRQL